MYFDLCKLYYCYVIYMDYGKKSLTQCASAEDSQWKPISVFLYSCRSGNILIINFILLVYFTGAI
jgi:hypothetical protein